MPTYGRQHFDPPAPAAVVTLRNPRSGASTADVLLLIDSGADVTLLPRTAVEQIGFAPNAADSYELLGFDGRRSTTQAVDLEMTFLGSVIRGRNLLIDDSMGILGRDVLNLFVTLDGPAREWSSP